MPTGRQFFRGEGVNRQRYATRPRRKGDFQMFLPIFEILKGWFHIGSLLYYVDVVWIIFVKVSIWVWIKQTEIYCCSCPYVQLRNMWIVNAPILCMCWKEHTRQHSMICKSSGFVSIRHFHVILPNLVFNQQKQSDLTSGQLSLNTVERNLFTVLVIMNCFKHLFSVSATESSMGRQIFVVE